jgi:lipopolysaccharide transport system ATP-binding protein
LKPIIEVNHIWKEYQKGIDRRYKSLRDTLVNIPGWLLGDQKEKFWALEDINFKVEAGESVGIIGRNGAGKSTLLKILSRITPPTKGEIILRGRVASLLEVGTGFHPELTGRENIFFNGSILGMKHAEIKRKFDEIVDFSGVDSFIDTPLKHYSSGMQMRLAFSVAAHLDSEILLIDEVLAVGDIEFQKKCIGKMDDVSKSEGKTILFVSHNMNLINKLCKYSINISNGKIKESGLSNQIIANYLNIYSTNQNQIQSSITYSSDDVIDVLKIDSIGLHQNEKRIFSRSEKIGIRIIYKTKNKNLVIRYGINVYNLDGVNLFDSHFTTSEYYKNSHPLGTFQIISWLPKEILITGDYLIGFGFFNHQTNSVFARGKNILTISIVNDKNEINPIDKIPGLINPKIEWDQIEK